MKRTFGEKLATISSWVLLVLIIVVCFSSCSAALTPEETKVVEPKEEVVVAVEEEEVEEVKVIVEEEESESARANPLPEDAKMYSYEYYSVKDQNLRFSFTVFYDVDGKIDEVTYFYQNDTPLTAAVAIGGSGEVFEVEAFKKDAGYMSADINEFQEIVLFFDEGQMPEDERTERFNLVEMAEVKE